MSTLIDRFIVASELTPDQTWQVVEWCAKHGADEFALTMLSLQGSSAPFLDEAEATLKPFERSIAPRKALTVFAGQSLVQPTRLWTLTDESIVVLKRFFADGLFTYPTAEWEVGCLEDPRFYRSAEVMLGVVSHEKEGVLALTDSEHAQIAALGIATRDRPEWI